PEYFTGPARNLTASHILPGFAACGRRIQFEPPAYAGADAKFAAILRARFAPIARYWLGAITQTDSQLSRRHPAFR
ncbi:MAG TPA: hypothetical protein VF472_11165, partial [Burkholderiaceae bacterium]